MNRFQLENRLLDFALNINKLTLNLKPDGFNIILKDQILRSSISVPLNYSEAHSAESKKDFLHKMKICLKELRETKMALRLLASANQTSNGFEINGTLRESDELISIFVASIKTAMSK